LEHAVKHVVIVEDNELVAKYLRYILEHEGGYRVSVTESGDEAIALARQSDTIAVLVDVSLRATMHAGRYIDGLELARLLKEDEQAAQVPVIIATAHGMAGDRERFLRESGADGFIRKPVVDSSELLSLIQSLALRES
jgi:two-component system cell cycle response regulator DivK